MELLNSFDRISLIQPVIFNGLVEVVPPSSAPTNNVPTIPGNISVDVSRNVSGDVSGNVSGICLRILKAAPVYGVKKINLEIF